ncbi:hypothetical protein GCM10009535_48910 [Streptomyces thermocarboxydovorans]|uniref:Uncharacterized protein n=1 Tax=Streptomyces thermocarboxydovorans TaxID=59298 RepID=A0ABP3STQ9_9ACTN
MWGDWDGWGVCAAWEACEIWESIVTAPAGARCGAGSGGPGEAVTAEKGGRSAPS